MSCQDNLVNQDDPNYAAEKAKAPYGQFPVLEAADGSLLAQSQAIEKFLAKEAGLLPSGTDLEIAQAESLYQFRQEIYQELVANPNQVSRVIYSTVLYLACTP
jgi:glutathione S-transferase